jgi:peroxiredoxin Q/BCP
VGISPDPVEQLRLFRDKYQLPFILLSDADHQVAERYGAWREKKMYGRTVMGIVRSHFIIDEEGRIVDVQMKVTPAQSVERAVAALRAMAGSAG